MIIDGNIVRKPPFAPLHDRTERRDMEPGSRQPGTEDVEQIIRPVSRRGRHPSTPGCPDDGGSGPPVPVPGSRSAPRAARRPIWRISSSISTGAGSSASSIRARTRSASASRLAGIAARTAGRAVRLAKPVAQHRAAARPAHPRRFRSGSRLRGSGGWRPWRGDRAASPARRKSRGPVPAHNWR